jgi:hypothetical protein
MGFGFGGARRGWPRFAPTRWVVGIARHQRLVVGLDGWDRRLLTHCDQDVGILVRTPTRINGCALAAVAEDRTIRGMPTLNWLGKDAVIDHHRKVPLRLLHDVPDLAIPGPADAPTHTLIEGDNLHALKALLPRYRGRVKCIYIDPPYNTGNEGWVYNDNVNSPAMRDWLTKEVGRDDLSRHDKWLCMMYPRLVLLREMLRQDGVIFISIEAVELANLTLIMDEIFGMINRVGTIVWKNVTDNNPTNIVPEHEYIICYARERKTLPVEWKSSEIPVETRPRHISPDFTLNFP